MMQRIPSLLQTSMHCGLLPVKAMVSRLVAFSTYSRMNLMVNPIQFIRKFNSSPSIIYSPKHPSIFQTLNSISRNGMNISFPKIAVIGNQSSGKSSLIEAICGIDNLFGKKTGMATRRPTSITLIKTEEGQDFIKIGHLGEKIYSVDKARQRLEEENSGDVTSTPLDVEIYSSKITKQCMVIDLPGFITATTDEESSDLPKTIRMMCEPYIQDSTNIKMIVMSATEDPALSKGLFLVKKHRQMDNAFAVFTKIDMIVGDRLKTKALVDLLRDRKYIPRLGAIGVKLRSSGDLASQTNIVQMLQNEQNFIKEWKLEDQKDLNLGVPKLVELVSTEQLKRISHTFPEIKAQVNKLLNEKKNGHQLIKKLVENEDLHGISQELERVISDLHESSPMRVRLELSLQSKIQNYIQNWVEQRYTKSRNIKYTQLSSWSHHDWRHILRRHSELDRFHSLKPNRLGDYLMYGGCRNEISALELTQVAQDNLSKALLIPFIDMIHPGKQTGDIIKYNREDFTRSISHLVSTMTSSLEFSKSVVNLATEELKNFMIKRNTPKESIVNSDLDVDLSSYNMAEIFFIHIFSKITERVNVDELCRSITQMVIREHRPYIEYDDLVHRSYLELQHNLTKTPRTYPGLFETDTYPIGVDLYGPVMLNAYVAALTERLSKDIFRMVAKNLLDPLIILTIELSLKTVKNKDFTKEDKDILNMISTLEQQLQEIENLDVHKL